MKHETNEEAQKAADEATKQENATEEAKKDLAEITKEQIVQTKEEIKVEATTEVSTEDAAAAVKVEVAIPAQTVMYVKNKEGKERLIFTDFKDIEFVTNRKKSHSLVNAKKNDIFEAKLHYDNANQRYLVLKIEKSHHTIDKIIDNAQEEIAIVDHINTQKKLFHYVINSRQDGVIHFDQTTLRPEIGNFIKIKYYSSNDKKSNKTKINILKIELTSEIKSSLLKSTTGELKLKYKEGSLTYDYDEIIDDQIDIDIRRPDFAFINDYYVPKYLLEKNNITSNTEVKVNILFNGEKWNVYKIEKI